VIVQHGLLCSSAAWVINTPDKNLPYVLADKGYDVWMGNVRGTLFGRNHTTLSPNSPEFWDYSFDEIANYDIPAIIDTILNKTGYKQIYYVGHSMGTTIGFTLLALQPKYNNIIRTMYAMAPALKIDRSRSPMTFLAQFISKTGLLMKLFGNREFMANNDIIKTLSKTLCTSPYKSVCSNIIFLFCGFDPEQLNVTRLPIYLHHTPAATSTQNINHFLQILSSGNFQRPDRGPTENKKRYGQMIPPMYDLDSITTKVALFWGENDLLADPTDVSWTAQRLKNVVLKYRVPFDKFAHLDFMWAIDVNRLVYDKLVDTMAKLWKD